jgi:predicted nuclease of restriction endonuclease-like (RecB) superfamily
VRSSQLKAAVAVNRELVLLYWEIGHEIRERQETLGWGAKVIDRLSRDLRKAFPEMKGLSPRNLKYMRAFAAAWPDREVVQQLVARVPWGHVVRILDKAKDGDERTFYVQKAVEAGWSRNVLVMQIESDLYGRQGKAVTNFHQALAAPGSDLAQQTLKDPYVFDFLGLAEDAKERDIEQAMIRHLKDTLVELPALPREEPRRRRVRAPRHRQAHRCGRHPAHAPSARAARRHPADRGRAGGRAGRSSRGRRR